MVPVQATKRCAAMPEIEPVRWSRRQFFRAGAAGLLGLAVPSRSAAQAPEEVPLPERQGPDRLTGPPTVSARAWAVADGTATTSRT